MDKRADRSMQEVKFSSNEVSVESLEEVVGGLRRADLDENALKCPYCGRAFLSDEAGKLVYAAHLKDKHNA